MNMNTLVEHKNLADVTLEDKYVLNSGPAFMSGMQVLVRLPITLQERAKISGMKLGGYISGYRGSPVGTYDVALWGAKSHLESRDIRFQAGVNEELAATAVWGSQQVKLLGESDFDGVFGLWYGKSPGVDRTLDVFRHGNNAGTSQHGGVLAIAGDDPNGVSSTVTGCSDYDFVSVGMPLLYPANVQEMLDFGVMGIELSKYSGCWVGLKAVTDIAESSAIVDVTIDRVPMSWPELEEGSADVHIRLPDHRVEQEKRLYETKLPRAKMFARFSGVNQLFGSSSDATVGIISAGKPWSDLMQAANDLGIDPDQMASRGIRLLKLGMIYPLDETQIREFASGLETVLVVEEKRGLIEGQVKNILYGSTESPRVIGKHDSNDAVLIPEHGETTPGMLAQVLARVFPALGSEAIAEARLQLLKAKEIELVAQPPGPTRTPFFCSGCPHNSSTKLPDGSIALAGIGCHWLTLFMDRETDSFTQMGGEGISWLGAMGFSSRKHVFANLGDGTYHHSGILAVRAAVYANAHITYKLLYNDAVAMTGGQVIADSFTPQQIVSQLLAEGVTKVVVVSDEPQKYRQVKAPNGGFPQSVTLHGRDQLEELQLQLRDTEGVTVLLYDQTCAAEKRRRRKRGTMTDPDVRAFINEAVCEGCGDCSVQSNCISIEPLETELGRKRQINQSACNKDLKCVDGFCPSFVTLKGAAPRKGGGKVNHDDDNAIKLPMPEVASLQRVHETVITGIGGTGVITIGAILAMAARLEGLGATCLDQTGIAQKNGAVLSHVRIGPEAAGLHSPRVAVANADLVLGCDMLVTASKAALSTMTPGKTCVVLNTHLAPNAGFVLDSIGARFDEKELRTQINASAGEDGVSALQATRMATKMFGDAIAANMIMLGFALQRGWLPVSLEAVQRAIEINGTAVKANLSALDWGRYAALDLEAATRAITPAKAVTFHNRADIPLEELIIHRMSDLKAYQNVRYAARYEELVRKVQAAESRGIPGSDVLTRAVATFAYKLMAYKDEYEVARLYTDGRFDKKLQLQFQGDTKLTFHMAPPLISKHDPVTGNLKKRSFGSWILGPMRILARLKAIRGSVFDPFGRTVERRTERGLIEMYFEVIQTLIGSLDKQGLGTAVAIASVPDDIRGFGHVKEKNMSLAMAKWLSLCQGTMAEPIICAFASQMPANALAEASTKSPMIDMRITEVRR
ncbi:MAG TPA: indolepyruvate ferredoxin oxidoreductase family protein [Eoetvoesiella sp.]